MWFWNGFPNEVRAITGCMFSRGVDGDVTGHGDHLGIGGTVITSGKLVFHNSNNIKQYLVGNTTIKPRTWNHVVLVRQGRNIKVYLNGDPKPEIDGEMEIGFPARAGQIFIGGRSDNQFNFEGKISDVAIYDRPLKPKEITKHYS